MSDPTLNPSPSSRISLGLINPKSVTNVGAVMRSAGCFDVSEVFYTGTRYARASQFVTDTKDHHQQIPLMAVDDILDNAPADSQVVCVELALGATPLTDYQHPENAFYIFGPEDGTIDQSIIDQADAVIYIPTNGCLNLAASVNVVLYDRLAKSGQFNTGDEWIKQNRDNKNRVKVKPVKERT